MALTDGEYQEEQEEEEDQESDDEAEEEDDDEVEITGEANLSTSRFDTSLDNSILLNSSATNNDDPIVSFYNENTPSVEKFELITDEDKLKAFKEFLTTTPEEDYLTHLVYTILKLSSISEQSKDALDVALNLFKDAFEYAKDKDRVRLI
jgi:hypothetical protein